WRAECAAEPPVLFKEKLNFKLPGGAGFAPHQDAPAFTSFSQTYHITLMLGTDATTPENGSLDLVDGFDRPETLPQADDGTLREDVVAGLPVGPLAAAAGDGA